MASLEKAGSETWGQIAISRRPAKTIAAGGQGPRGRSRDRGPSRAAGALAPVVEGDLVKEVARKLGPDVEVEGVSP